MSEDQIDDIMKETPGIDTIVRDTPGRLNGCSVKGRKRHFEKRDNVEVKLDAMTDLAYISAIRGAREPQDRYAHFPNAGDRITVYLADSGVTPENEEFASSVIRR